VTRVAWLGVALALAGCSDVLGIERKVYAEAPGAGGSGGQGGAGGAMCDDAAPERASDPASCGRCGHDCLGGGCVLGKCQPVALATGQANPHSLAVDDTWVYWSNFHGHAVLRTLKSGGDAAHPIATFLTNDPVGIAIDDDYVYIGCYPGSVWRVTKDGNGLQQLVGGVNLIQGLAVQGDSVFYSTGEPGSTLYRVPKAGGPSEPLYQQGWVLGLVSDGEHLYVADATNRLVLRLTTTGAVTVIDDADNVANLISYDDTFLYWFVNYGRMLKKRKDNTGTVTELDEIAGGPYGLVADDGYLYWSDPGVLQDGMFPPGSGRVARLRTDFSAATEVLADGFSDTLSVRLDAEAIYFTNSTPDGTVMKLARPLD
jgi:hypothetical protein